ncbi:dead end protein 1 isoform X1 [Pitangus sulphuratus]|nr:dead end protein 1 isoform X1 [Pitangus sulphuratus]
MMMMVINSLGHHSHLGSKIVMTIKTMIIQRSDDHKDNDNTEEDNKWTNSINQASKTSLLAWERETGIELVQINGQRRYGGPPPGWVGAPPPAGTEVYIGKLPQDLYEDVLIPLFQSVGKLYEFRLMMTFSGLNRGFAYARYCSQRGARDAIAAFNNYQVRRGCAIVVCRSTQKRELSVDGLAASVSQQELEVTLQRATQGILSVTLHASPHQGQAKLAVLKYSSHQAAALAKKTLMEGEWCPYWGWASWCP